MTTLTTASEAAPVTADADADTGAAVRTRGLTKRYGNRTVVDDVALDVPTGVVCGFVGPNGAGKTTTIRMLLGLVRPSAGSGSVLGRPLERPSAYIGEVGALIEGPASPPPCRVPTISPSWRARGGFPCAGSARSSTGSALGGRAATATAPTPSA